MQPSTARMRLLELKVPPLIVFALTGALIWLVARASPDFHIEIPGREFIAAGLFVAGVAVAMIGVVSFRRARTTVNPLDPALASALVISGVYRWTRNPMYLGTLLCLLGWAAFKENAIGFLLLPGFVGYLNRFQIVPEEAALRERFGAEFESYRARVRRWI